MLKVSGRSGAGLGMGSGVLSGIGVLSCFTYSSGLEIALKGEVLGLRAEMGLGCARPRGGRFGCGGCRWGLGDGIGLCSAKGWSIRLRRVPLGAPG
jgi:hypothetical protein